MATFTIFHEAINNVLKNLIDLDSHTFKAVLTNTAPVQATGSVLADITQIASGNGYTTGGATLASVTLSETSSGTGIWKWTANDITFAASGGSIAAHRYLVIYSDTATNDELVGYVDSGTSAAITDGNSRTWDIGTNGLIQSATSP